MFFENHENSIPRGPNGLPLHIDFMNSLNAKPIPRGVRLEDVNAKIRETLETLETLKSLVYDEHRCVWTATYGTEPLFNALDPQQKQVYHRKQQCFYELFNSVAYIDEDEYDYLTQPPPTLFYKRAWCMMEIKVRHSVATEQMVLVFNRYSGDRTAYFYMKDLVKCAVHNENWTWSVRRPYLSLAESAANQYETQSHIMRYLMDENIMRDVCGYMF